jgi:hypothetical protein
VASGVDAPLSTFAHVFGRGAHAGAQTVTFGDVTPQQHEKHTRQMIRRAEFCETLSVFHKGFC